MGMRIYQGYSSFRTIFFSMLTTALLTQHAYAQEAIQHPEHDNGHDVHDHTGEVGISTGYVYLEHEEKSAIGLHLHVIRRLGETGFPGRIGLGAGFEMLFADHPHYTVMGSVVLYPYRSLSITLSPGALFVEHDGELEREYATHLEASYGFFLGEYEVGPVVGYAKSADDTHYSLGIHVGRGF